MQSSSVSAAVSKSSKDHAISIAEYDVSPTDESESRAGHYFTNITFHGHSVIRSQKSSASQDDDAKDSKKNKSGSVTGTGTGTGTKQTNGFKLALQKVKVYYRDIYQKTKRNLFELFLPIGYPNTTNEGYMKYQTYDSIQGLSNYLRGVVSTTAVLTAAGVGDSNAIPHSAAVQWALKDGCGMIGGLLFSYFASSFFDSHVKEFRLFADVINDVAHCLDMICPLLERKYIMMVSTFSTLCRVMCGMAAGATKNCITHHFARGNLADLSAKEGTQETLVSLVGMMLGIYLATFLQDMEKNSKILEDMDTPPSASSYFHKHSAFYATWFVFLQLTILHIWANYIGVKTLKLETLNRERAKVALNKVISRMAMLVEIKDAEVDDDHTLLNEIIRGNATSPSSRTVNVLDNGCSINSDSFRNSNVDSIYILPPQSCCESMWKSCRNLIVGDNLKLGTGVSTALEGFTSHDIEAILKLYKDEEYILTITPKGFICVCLRVRLPPDTSSTSINKSASTSANTGKRKKSNGKKNNINSNTSTRIDINSKQQQHQQQLMKSLMNVDTNTNSNTNTERKQNRDQDPTTQDREENLILLKSFMHALIIQEYHESCGISKSLSSASSRPVSRHSLSLHDTRTAIETITRSKKCVDSLFPAKGNTILDLLEERGWSCRSLYFNYGKTRYQYEVD